MQNKSKVNPYLCPRSINPVCSMFRNHTLFLIFVLTVTQVSGQLKYYAEPLKIPVSLSGNFGELRSGHFHMGLDFRTERRIGLPVVASAAGTVSRISVSPTGYGRALYINHPNNTTTVYGHLLKFRDDIEEYVKAEQYLRNSFAVDLMVPVGKFTVERGEQIALSGNSGSSEGPHLHYEIRDTPTQDALNPLLINNFNVKDLTAPRISAVQFYPLDDRSHVDYAPRKKKFHPTGTGNRYKLNPDNPVTAWGQIGIAVRADDFFDANQSPCGIFSARLLFEGEEIFSYTLERISYSHNGYLNSHIDYGEYVTTRERFQKMWRDPGNRLGVYRSSDSRGILTIDSAKTYQGQVILTDVNGNSAVFGFRIRGADAGLLPAKEEPGSLFRYNLDNEFRAEGFEIRSPKGAFYEDFKFKYQSEDGGSAYFSPIHRVHEITTPVHLPVTIRIRAAGLPDSLAGKAFIAVIDEKGKPGYAGGKYAGGWFETRIGSFGNYAVSCDTIPPEVTPLTLKNNALTDTNEIRFRIKDDFSGIGRYEGWIDGEWALFEYDPKFSRLSYKIDTARIGSGKRHSLELSVTDRSGNTTVFRSTFWK